MRFEDLKPIKVLSEEEFKKEFNRINQKDALKVTASATGFMAICRLLKYSPMVDETARTLFNTVSSKSVTAYSTVTANLTKKVGIPYVFSISNLQIYIGVGVVLALLCLFAIVVDKVNGRSIKETIIDCALIISPLILWGLMEVFF